MASETFSYETKRRPYWGICYIISGEIKYVCKDIKFSAGAGKTVVLKKGACYRVEFAEETHCILVNFAANGDFAADEEKSIIITDTKPDIKSDFADILDYSIFDEKRCMVKSVFYRILYKMGKNGFENALSVRIKNILNADADFSLCEAEIAKQCAVSISTAQRSFSKAYGKTISAYRSELRLARAKSLLLTGLYSVEQVAEMLGFCDCAYFSRSFKRLTGMSPKKFIKQSYTM